MAKKKAVKKAAPKKKAVKKAAPKKSAKKKVKRVLNPDETWRLEMEKKFEQLDIILKAIEALEKQEDDLSFLG